jgi:hypothetical protein
MVVASSAAVGGQPARPILGIAGRPSRDGGTAPLLDRLPSLRLASDVGNGEPDVPGTCPGGFAERDDYAVPQPPKYAPRRTAGPFLAILLAACALNATGCTYLKYRGEDALETFDIGVTLSKQPHLSLYACGASIITFGYSKFDGILLGMGGGFFGKVEHENKCWGNGFYGEESLVWGKNRRPWKRYRHRQGIQGALSQRRVQPPAYFPACVHNFHLGWIGFVGNIRYTEMLDFILGFTTFDLAGDDGRVKGNWFFY